MTRKKAPREPNPMRVRPPDVLWFAGPRQHHAFLLDGRGRMDVEACCGLDVDACADEPARTLEAFEGAPACGACLAVVELNLPR